MRLAHGLALVLVIGWLAGGTPVYAAGNLALHKPAQQSSTSQWSHPDDAQGAVDGVKNGRFGFHTNHEPNPWWQVDLQGVNALGEVRIFNRIDNVPERSRTLQILLSVDGVTWQRAYTHDGQPFGGTDGKPLVVALNGAQARFVRLQLNDTTWFHLDEVEVYGTAGMTGQAQPVGRSYTAQPRGPGDQVLVVAYGKDETDGSDVGWNEPYPNPSFDDDPGRRGLPNARWQGSHSWDGSRLCLSIKNLEAPHPPAHTLAIGYTVTLTSGTFEDGTTTKTFVLYRYSGVPAQKEVTQCFATRTVEASVPTGRSFTAQPRVPEAAASPPAGWETTASAHRGKNGQRFTYVCPAGGTPTRVWGTDVYTDDSSVCTAAVHTGRIVPSTGGSVTIEIKPGQNSYMGTGRNDILSESYGPWTGSFIFVGAGQPQGRSYTAQPRQAESSDPLKKEFGESLKKMFKP
jgi:hypothetical protein